MYFFIDCLSSCHALQLRHDHKKTQHMVFMDNCELQRKLVKRLWTMHAAKQKTTQKVSEGGWLKESCQMYMHIHTHPTHHMYESRAFANPTRTASKCVWERKRLYHGVIFLCRAATQLSQSLINSRCLPILTPLPAHQQWNLPIPHDQCRGKRVGWWNVAMDLIEEEAWRTHVHKRPPDTKQKGEATRVFEHG